MFVEPYGESFAKVVTEPGANAGRKGSKKWKELVEGGKTMTNLALTTLHV